MKKLVIRTKQKRKEEVKQEIKTLDTTTKFDPEENPITFWVTTKLPLVDVLKLDGVIDVLESIA